MKWTIALMCLATPGLLSAASASKTPTTAEIVEASGKDEWRKLDPARTLYLQLPQGRVVIELAPAFGPQHVANILTLVKGKYFDGLAVIRAQDNFVVQWGDPDDNGKPLGAAKSKLPPEYTTAYDTSTVWTRSPDLDGQAPQVGFTQSMATGRDPASRSQWLTHCYGALGVARGNDPESGNGSSLYVVIGQAPRQLDRNVAVVGKVWQGMELLATLARGPGAMGFYETAAARTPITSVRVAADLPATERIAVEVLRDDSRSFERLLDARRHRRDDWMKLSPGYIDVCNMPIPVRPAA